MFEEEIYRFRLGKRIIDDIMHDRLNPQNRRHSEEVHMTRLSGLQSQSLCSLECIGFLAGIAWNFVKYPREIRNAMPKSEDKEPY